MYHRVYDLYSYMRFEQKHLQMKSGRFLSQQLVTEQKIFHQSKGMAKTRIACCTFLFVFLKICVQGSVKKGGAIGPENFKCDDFEALNNIFWWYDWGANLDMIRKYSNCSNIDQYVDTFVPMIWGRWDILNKTIPRQAEYVLGFNEPNHFEQSNITAEQAAKYWPYIEQISSGRLLVSPSAAPCGSACHGNATQWFDKFFKYCSDCRIDYLATHYYSCNVDETMSFLRNLYQRYGKKIWLTEFDCPHTASPDKERYYMKQLLPQLEAAPFIYRYSWYASRITKGVFVTPAVSLLEPDSSVLTYLGRTYNSFNAGHNRSKIETTFVHILNFISWLWTYFSI